MLVKQKKTQTPNKPKPFWKVQAQVSYLQMLVFMLISLQEIFILIAHLSTKPWLPVEIPREMK